MKKTQKFVMYASRATNYKIGVKAQFYDLDTYIISQNGRTVGKYTEPLQRGVNGTDIPLDVKYAELIKAYHFAKKNKYTLLVISPFLFGKKPSTIMDIIGDYRDVIKFVNDYEATEITKENLDLEHEKHVMCLRKTRQETLPKTWEEMQELTKKRSETAKKIAKSRCDGYKKKSEEAYNRAVQLKEEGHKYGAIAKVLNEEEFKTVRDAEFDYQKVYHLLK